MGTTLFTLVVMMAVAYAFLREGAVTGLCALCNIVLAGLLAFNFWEPLANQLDGSLKRTILEGYEDFLCLGFLFCVSLALLRLATNHLTPSQLQFNPRFDQVCSLVIGMLTGYLLAGFLLCVLQTLPWHERFMSFDANVDPDGPTHKMRRWLPPDRVWLAMMHKASAVSLARSNGVLFDRNGTFEQRYLRFRRFSDERDPLPPGVEAEP